MSKLGIEQKTVRQLLGDNKADFLIPDYQRPYAWEEKECQTLWDDIFAFAFPDNDCDKFDRHNDEYFLGPIVTFLNDDSSNHQFSRFLRLGNSKNKPKVGSYGKTVKSGLCAER